MIESRNRASSGVVLGLAAALAFGAGGAFVKPLLEAGWSPGAAVLARISVAALVLLYPALRALRFDVRPLWRARWTVLIYAAVAVAGTQVAFYAAIARIPVGTALLIEYLAPIALVLLAWLRSRRVPQVVVLAGSVLALLGLVLVIGPAGGGLDVIGLLFAVLAMLGVAVYYVVGARVDDDVPPVALAGSGFVLGAMLLGLAGACGALPMSADFGEVAFLGGQAPWFVPVLTVGVLSTAFAYVAGIAAIARLGTRLASFLGLAEVVFAAILSWMLLGESLSVPQLFGGALILAGIVCVRLERPETNRPGSVVGAAAMDEPVVPERPAPRRS
ncbi:EamA family transporter [Rathayibacter sp. YIM 133350]|uniref:EamA family transporter n=1 Tax=Rathayibacter sp. YIM 133350 TaxID=3131992 RepID=UPI00307F6C4C